jgi:hypothetical protein
MTTPLSPKILEALSAFLDGELTVSEQANVKKLIQTDPEIRREYLELLTIKRVLQAMPVKHASRRLTLSPEMVGKKNVPFPRLIPVFGLASMVSLLLAIFSLFSINFQATNYASAPAMEPAPMSEKMSGKEINPTVEARNPEIIIWGGGGGYSSQPVGRGGGGGGGNGIEEIAPPQTSNIQPPAAAPMEASVPGMQVSQSPQENGSLPTPVPEINLDAQPQPALISPFSAETSQAAKEIGTPTQMLEPSATTAETPTLVFLTPTVPKALSTSMPVSGDSPILGIPSVDSRGKIQAKSTNYDEPVDSTSSGYTLNILIVRIFLAALAILSGVITTALWIRYKNASR